MFMQEIRYNSEGLQSLVKHSGVSKSWFGAVLPVMLGKMYVILKVEKLCQILIDHAIPSEKCLTDNCFTFKHANDLRHTVKRHS